MFSARLALAVILFLAFAHSSPAAEGALGFEVKLEAEGFVLNPIVTKLIVDAVTKGSVAEAAGMRVGDLILQVNGQVVAGKRALSLRSLMKMEPGETRTLRLKHTDGTEVDARVTKPRG